MSCLSKPRITGSAAWRPNIFSVVDVVVVIAVYVSVYGSTMLDLLLYAI